MSEKRTILFVDDDERIRKGLQLALIDEPYQCLFATSAKQALDLLDRHEVHAICTDMQMPDMTGMELLKIVKSRHPDIVRVVLSGYTQVGMLLTAINQGEIFKFITKPWKLEDEFKVVMQQAIEYYNLKADRSLLAAELEKYKQLAAKTGAAEGH
jgi:two-component system response regulator HupR/HoxA